MADNEVRTDLVLVHSEATATIARADQLVSQNDVQPPVGRTWVQVIWELSVTAVDAATCQFADL